jgi:hypothetical protein
VAESAVWGSQSATAAPRDLAPSHLNYLSHSCGQAIAYPGGDRYKLYDECEQNEFAEGCGD